MAVAIKVRRADKYPRPRRMIRTIVAGKMNVVVHVPNNCSPIARVVQEVIGVTVVIKVELTTSADTRRTPHCWLRSVDRHSPVGCSRFRWGSRLPQTALAFPPEGPQAVAGPAEHMPREL